MKSIFVGNLAFATTEDDLRAAFQPYGTVERVTVMKDRDGQPRGFGFVDMTTDNEAADAIQALNGTNLGGRNVNVSEARPKPVARSHDRGFGGGRDRERGGRGSRGGRW